MTCCKLQASISNGTRPEREAAVTSRIRDVVSITSGSESISRVATSSGSGANNQATQEITPEIADARQFEERLERGIKEGSFLALIVNPKCYQRAVSELQNRFSIELIDIEGLIVDTLRDVASKANAKWEASSMPTPSQVRNHGRSSWSWSTEPCQLSRSNSAARARHSC